MKITTVLYDDLEAGDVPGFAVRVYAVGTDIVHRAAPLFARVGAQTVEEIFISPDGDGFSGFLAQPRAEGDRLFAHYMDEPEVGMEAEDVEPPLIA